MSKKKLSKLLALYLPYEAADGWRRRCPHRYHPDPPAERSVRLIFSGRRLPPRTYLLASISSPSVENNSYYKDGTHCKSNIHCYLKGRRFL